MLEKLKHEWKTFTLAILGVVLGAHDAIVAAGYAPDDFAPILPETWKPYAPLAFGLLMLALRRYKDVADK